MEHPYRPELPVVAPRGRAVVVETERPLRGVVVRRMSDGSTELAFGSPRPVWQRMAYGVIVVGCVLGGTNLPQPWCQVGVVVPVVAAFMMWQGLASMKRERVMVTPAAVVVRRDRAVAASAALSEVATVLVADDGVSIVVGRELVPIARQLGYDEVTLRWIAQRLRQAIEAAR